MSKAMYTETKNYYVTASGTNDIFGVNTKNEIFRCPKPCILKENLRRCLGKQSSVHEAILQMGSLESALGISTMSLESEHGAGFQNDAIWNNNYSIQLARGCHTYNNNYNFGHQEWIIQLSGIIIVVTVHILAPVKT